MSSSHGFPTTNLLILTDGTRRSNQVAGDPTNSPNTSALEEHVRKDRIEGPAASWSNGAQRVSTLFAWISNSFLSFSRISRMARQNVTDRAVKSLRFASSTRR